VVGKSSRGQGVSTRNRSHQTAKGKEGVGRKKDLKGGDVSGEEEKNWESQVRVTQGMGG